ncbi:MAG: mannose-6-phosphate isomerase, class I [Micromonosporaceae bacterium]
MWRLEGRIRPYAWGSRTGIAALQGRPAPSPGPEAELWLGAHPDDPSLLVREGDTTLGAPRGGDTTLGAHREGDTTLLAAIEADPEGMLGAGTVKRFGPRLPYLLKLLAAEAPLSLQAHPDLAQARAGYAAEQAARVPLSAPVRNYSDPNHKPELLVAVGEFVALCGFRPVAGAAALLDGLRLPVLSATVDRLAAGELRTAVTGLYRLDAASRAELVAGVAAGSAQRATTAPEYAEAAALAARYPGDVGVVVSFLLNRVVLAPGEAIFMPAGNPHAYLRGVGVEVMASSDNVLRGGLTSKHVDVPELLRVLRFTELDEPRVAARPVAEPLARPVAEPPPVARPVAEGVVWWPVPVPDFRLLHARLTGGEVTLPVPGDPSPRIVFCLTGEVRLAGAAGELTLTAGQAGFAPPTTEPVVLSGTGEVFQATTA